MTYLGISTSGNFLVATNDEDLHRFGELRGDVSGTLDNHEVQRIRGQVIENAVPSSGDLLQFDGTQWSYSASMSTTHNLLSSTHPDTAPNDPVRGDLIVGSGAGPLWNRLPLGTAEFVLYSDGTDALYTRLGPNTPFELGTAAAPSVTFTGDTDTGLSAQTPDTLVMSASGQALVTAAVTDAGDRVTLDAGQVVRQRAVSASTTMLDDDYILLLEATNLTIGLPANPVAGQVVIIKDSDGLGGPGAGARHTITGNGNQIDGNNFIRIRRAYGSFTLLYNGGEWNII